MLTGILSKVSKKIWTSLGFYYGSFEKRVTKLLDYFVENNRRDDSGKRRN